MNASKWFVTATALSGGLVSLVMAQTTQTGKDLPPTGTRAAQTSAPTSAPTETRPSDSWLREQCNKMAEAVGFTEQQYEQLEKNIAAVSRAKTEWLRRNGEKLAKFAQEVREAREAKDRLRMRAIEKKLQPLLEDREKVFGDDFAVIKSIMTDEQKTAYEGWRFLRSAMRIYQDVQVTDGQKLRINGLCMKAGAEKRKTRTFREATAVRKELMKTILDDVLTIEQRITYMAAKLNRSAMGHYARTNLTERQKAQILQLCRKYGAQQLEVTYWRDKANLRRALLYDTYHQVLTTEQKSLIERKPAPPRKMKQTRSPATLPSEHSQVTTQPAQGPAKHRQTG